MKFTSGRQKTYQKNPTEVPFWEIKGDLSEQKAKTQIPSCLHYSSHLILLEPVEEGSVFTFLWALHPLFPFALLEVEAI